MRRLACLFLMLAAANVAAQDDVIRQLIESIDTPRDTPIPYTEVRMNPLLEAPVIFYGEVEFASDGTLEKRVSSPVVELVRIGAGVVVLERGNKKRSLSMRQNGNLWRFYSGLRAILAGDAEGVTEVYAVELQVAGESWQMELRPRSDEFATFISSITVRGQHGRIDFVRTVQGQDNWQETSFRHPDRTTTEADQ